MSFDFQQFVKKSTRGLFIFIIATMVLPLVLWGYMGGDPAGTPEEQGTAGVIFGSVKVSKAEFRRAQEGAAASYWWSKFEPFDSRMLPRIYQYLASQPPSNEQLVEQAWQNLILLQEAKQHGLEATEREVLLFLREVYGKFTQSYDYREAAMQGIARDLLHLPPGALQGWARNSVVIRKLLDLVEEAEFSGFDEVYGRLLDDTKVARAWVASFEPGDAARTLRAPTTDEIAAAYAKARDKYKVPQKVQVSYLMASFESLQKDVPEPTAEDVKKYYEEHKAEFAKEHHHEPGEEHKEDEKPEYRPFDEVKGELPAKIKLKAAEKKALELLAKVDVELGALMVANQNKVPDDAFDQLKAKFKAQGVDLVHDITLPFDARRVEEVESVLGTGSALGSWPFGTGVAAGEVSKVMKTSKGAMLLRLNRKIDPFDPGITDRVREHLVKELQKEQLRKRVQKKAEEAANIVNEVGLSAARRRVPAEWRMTRYFKVGSTDMGLDDYAMTSVVSRKVQDQQLSAGKAVAVSGQELGRDKADRSYVVYLEDRAPAKPENLEGQFTGQRRSSDAQARRAYRDAYIKETVKLADLKLDPSMKSSEKKENPTP